jgi:hypothetical protein
VESEAAAVPGYVNRPVGHAPERRVRLTEGARGGGRRASMRIARVALRAYEQRAERRALMRAWLLARSGASAAAVPATR